MKFSLKTKKELYSALKENEYYFGILDEQDFSIPFLSEIWDLRNMESEDNRFEDALGDIIQHTINNDDWDIDYLFIDRLKLFKDDDIYAKWLETLVHPKFRKKEEDILKYVLLINSFLEIDRLALYVTDYSGNDLPIYTLKGVNNENHYIDLPENQVWFFVETELTGRSDKVSSHKNPSLAPCFILAYDDGWNDYSLWTSFDLFYYETTGNQVYLGKLKITNGKDEYTIESIPESFTTLDDTFCSLGQGRGYYKGLKDVLGNKFESVLYALKDAAFYPDVHDKFEKNYIFKTSLLREDSAERMLREAKHISYDYDLQNLYSFKYCFTPKYSKTEVEIDFDFNKNNKIPDRIFALIGKNGTGKTQLISTLPLDIANKKYESFVPRPPLFSKVIAVSYSIFDDFEIPQKTSQFNYVYCGLHIMRNGKREILSAKSRSLRFHQAWKKIRKQERMQFWYDSLLTFIERDFVDSFIIEDEAQEYTVDIQEFNKIKKKLSSGQSIMLYIISEIISNIRYDSLILFDEPETHLHPNAISQLMNLIYKLVRKYDSYCLITTHSPLIIQELLSRNIYVIDRHESLPSIRKIGLESFGENLSILTEEVFGNKEIGKQYKTIIDRLINRGFNYDNIVEMIETDEIPLSLNARLYIKSRVEQ